VRSRPMVASAFFRADQHNPAQSPTSGVHDRGAGSRTLGQ
jgi:hypothetical protein